MTFAVKYLESHRDYVFSQIDGEESHMRLTESVVTTRDIEIPKDAKVIKGKSTAIALSKHTLVLVGIREYSEDKIPINLSFNFDLTCLDWNFGGSPIEEESYVFGESKTRLLCADLRGCYDSILIGGNKKCVYQTRDSKVEFELPSWKKDTKLQLVCRERHAWIDRNTVTKHKTVFRIKLKDGDYLVTCLSYYNKDSEVSVERVVNA